MLRKNELPNKRSRPSPVDADLEMDVEAGDLGRQQVGQAIEPCIGNCSGKDVRKRARQKAA
eukprot:10894341-Heterocapsa_arctica.AAC.1